MFWNLEALSKKLFIIRWNFQCYVKAGPEIHFRVKFELVEMAVAPPQ